MDEPDRSNVEPAAESKPAHHGRKAALVPTVKDLQTRFLYPFVFQRAALKKSAAALRAQSFSSRGGEKHPLWDCAAPHDLYSQPHEHYQDELLDHVIVHLFPGLDPDFREEASKGCGYLRLSPVAANKWFQGTRLILDGRKQAEGANADQSSVKLIPEIGIEVFLSPQGIGVLSVALTPGREGLGFDEVTNFNYCLAQYRRDPVARFHKPHPSERVEEFERIPLEKRNAIPLAPDEKAPLVDRLGAAGGTFDLRELIGWILAPLEAHGMPPVSEDLEELLVYTVARFGPEVDFGELDGKEELGRFLSGQAQVEEPRHVGASPGPLALSNGLLNANHWTAVGLLGATHLVVDQPPEIGPDGKPREIDFNNQKVPIVRDKYFIPYLIALLQRLALNRATQEAVEILSKAGETPAKQLQGLSQQLLEFAIGGHFPQISRRHALHRFYQIAREGLDIPNACQEVRRSISDIDATYAARRLEQVAENVQDNVNVMKEIARETTTLTKGMHGSLEFMAHAQGFVELIEIFLVSVYAAHLTHMLAWEHDPFRGLYVAASAALGAVVTAYFATKKKRHMVTVSAVAGGLYLLASILVATTILLDPENGAEQAGPRIPEFHLPSKRSLVAWASSSLLVLGAILVLCLRKFLRPDPQEDHVKAH